MTQPFDASALLDCYRRGVFPMADSREDPRIFLFDPDMRGVLPLDGLHISRSLAKFMRRMTWDITYNAAFSDVIALCAESAPDRPSTWINHGIEHLYTGLHHMGHAHSVEVWEGEQLVGGLYGVSIGAAFFGESMVSRRTNASKVALVKLVARLNAAGYVLLDTQFITDHLQSLGGVEITRDEYQTRLKAALVKKAEFTVDLKDA